MCWVRWDWDGICTAAERRLWVHRSHATWTWSLAFHEKKTWQRKCGPYKMSWVHSRPALQVPLIVLCGSIWMYLIIINFAAGLYLHPLSPLLVSISEQLTMQVCHENNSTKCFSSTTFKYSKTTEQRTNWGQQRCPLLRGSPYLGGYRGGHAPQWRSRWVWLIASCTWISLRTRH